MKDENNSVEFLKSDDRFTQNLRVFGRFILIFNIALLWFLLSFIDSVNNLDNEAFGYLKAVIISGLLYLLVELVLFAVLTGVRYMIIRYYRIDHNDIRIIEVLANREKMQIRMNQIFGIVNQYVDILLIIIMIISLICMFFFTTAIFHIQ